MNLNNPIAERKNKTIYKDGNKIIKLFVESHPKSNVLNEALNHSRVEESSNLNVPKSVLTFFSNFPNLSTISLSSSFLSKFNICKIITTTSKINKTYYIIKTSHPYQISC